ncbi:MAG: AAA family ATPase [Dehalococcoidales bacterium]|nr:AAA family ATPase [Dehalococcoidales bacterium]
MPKVTNDDLDVLLEILPPHIRQPLCQQEDVSSLLEVVIDLGRYPEARFPNREVVLSSQEVTQDDIDYITSRISSFGDDNRAGIERTLHRISAIRNRKGKIVGLSCRVGRAVYGTIQIIEDLVQSGQSVLLLGRPGIGKTTMLREAARVLSDDMKKRVVIVDTSNEIAGDGDIPHPAIGHSRRMQVSTPTMQHAVMIEAVENHMPEVIIIDEIGTELEAQAARTIAERGVQLIGTAHGNTLENLMLNPTLSDLVGGIQSVTLGDEEAKRRGTQKTILERKSPPTFSIVVEIQDRYKVAVHPDVGEAIDELLRGQQVATEVRWLNEDDEVSIKREEPVTVKEKRIEKYTKERSVAPACKKQATPRLYPFGINRIRLEQAAEELHVPLNITDDLRNADMMITSKSYYRRKAQKIRDAETASLPVYVLRKHTPMQLKQMLATIYPAAVGLNKNEGKGDTLDSAIKEAEVAVDKALESNESVELGPQGAYIRRLQHIVAERNNLSSKSLGKEPNRRVSIFKE